VLVYEFVKLRYRPVNEIGSTGGSIMQVPPASSDILRLFRSPEELG
jgi:hypothetical protein